MLLRAALLALTATLLHPAFSSPHAMAQTSGTREKPIRVGIIGLDTSHVSAFTNAIQGAKAAPELAGMRVVAAYPGGSADIPTSIDRVPGFIETVKKLGVEIVDSIEELLPKVDVVLLESVDGRPHLEQARPVIAAGKPLFIDKPVAASLADAIEIYRLAEAAKVPCFSSSMLRFSPATAEARDNPKLGEIVGCVAYSPCSLEEHHPDLFWYGIHGTEILFTIMGPGCESVSRVHTEDTDVVTGVWKDGRVGTVYGHRKGNTDYGAMVYGRKGNDTPGRRSGYEHMIWADGKFFETGKPPVTPAETIEIIAFMEAADESKRQNGASVTLESMMERARSTNAKRASAGSK